MLAEIAKQHGIGWEQKGTHEEHLDVYNFKKKERKKEVQELEQKKEYLTAENEGLTSQIADARADIKLLEEEKTQFQKDKEVAEKCAEKAGEELKKLEDRREFLQPVMDNVSKEIKEYGMIKTFLPEVIALERAVTYRDKKIKPLFIEMKNKIGAMAALVKELTRERDSWKSKFQKKRQEHENTKKELAEVQKDYQKLSGEKEMLLGLADRYNRLLRMLGKDMVERLVQDDIRIQEELEAKKQKEQMPRKIGDRIQWAKERSEEHNAHIRKIKQSTEKWSCKNMKKQIYDEKNRLSYILHGDYYLPDLEINEEEPTYGKYGIMRKQFLKEHRSARYQYLVLTGKLTEYLNQVDKEVREKVEMLVEQMAEQWGVTEELKIQN